MENFDVLVLLIEFGFFWLFHNLDEFSIEYLVYNFKAVASKRCGRASDSKFDDYRQRRHGSPV